MLRTWKSTDGSPSAIAGVAEVWGRVAGDVLAPLEKTVFLLNIKGLTIGDRCLSVRLLRSE